jgi:mevalonate kinase
MIVKPIKKPIIDWKSFDEKGQVWYRGTFDLPLTTKKNDNKVASTLKLIFKQAQKQNPSFLSTNQGYKIVTKLDFSRNWGLGSSSTLINNMAQWAKIDAFELLQKTMGGSGYDIACAQNDFPIIYQINGNNPLVKKALFNPKLYKDQLYFVYLNQKQYSDKEVANFKTFKKDFKIEIAGINEITDLLLKVKKLCDFELLIKEHEKIMSRVLQRKTIQDHLFPDYFGQIKSLGAWGGDFVLATGNEDTPAYFKKKGLNTILLYDEMILK